jgi:hypothetical protein
VRIALHQSALLGHSWCEQLAVAQNQHWQRVGVVRKTLWKYGAAAVARSMRSHHLTASTLSWTGGFTGSVGFSYHEAIADARDTLREAAAISAETVVVAPGDRNGHTFRHARRLVVDGLKAIVDDAASLQINLALLVNPPARCALWSHINADDFALELLDEIASPWLGLACPLPKWDGHAAQVERWQRVVRRAWVVWNTAESQLVTVGVADTLRRLTRSGFAGVWELRGHTNRGIASREQRDCCRSVSEALGLNGATRTGGVLI